jgi:hypothetical protein
VEGGVASTFVLVGGTTRASIGGLVRCFETIDVGLILAELLIGIFFLAGGVAFTR